MTTETKPGTRILSRSLARELSAEEIAIVSGGSSSCTKSTYTGSDNTRNDLDHCGDFGSIDNPQN